MSKTDNSLVIRNGPRTGDVIVSLGSEFANKDGDFDRTLVPGTYVRVQPGQKVEPSWIPSHASKEVHDFVENWIREHGGAA